MQARQAESRDSELRKANADLNRAQHEVGLQQERAAESAHEMSAMQGELEQLRQSLQESLSSAAKVSSTTASAPGK